MFFKHFYGLTLLKDDRNTKNQNEEQKRTQINKNNENNVSITKKQTHYFIPENQIYNQNKIYN